MTTTQGQPLEFSLHDFQNLLQKAGTENCSKRSMTKNCWKISSRPTGLFYKFCRNDSTCNPFPAATTQLFLQSLSSHKICSCLEIFSSTNNLCNFWRSIFNQVSNYAFCSWDDIITQKRKCKSPKILCKCTKVAYTLSTRTSIEWNLYMSRISILVTSFKLEMIAGGFSKHQNKSSDADRYKRYISTARVFQINVITMRRIFEQRSEL